MHAIRVPQVNLIYTDVALVDDFTPILRPQASEIRYMLAGEAGIEVRVDHHLHRQMGGEDTVLGARRELKHPSSLIATRES